MRSACTTHVMLCFYGVPCLAMPRAALPCPALPCPALPCPALRLSCQRCPSVRFAAVQQVPWHCMQSCMLHCCSLCSTCFLTLLLCLQTKSLQTRQASAQLQIPPPPNHSQAVTAQPMCMMASFVHHHSLLGQPLESLLTVMAS